MKIIILIILLSALIASAFIVITVLRIKFSKNPFYDESEPKRDQAPEEYNINNHDIDL